MSVPLQQSSDPATPSDGDFEDLCYEFGFLTDDAESQEILFQMFREVLDRWSPAPTSVSVTERLPEEADMHMHESGRAGACWWYFYDSWLYRQVVFVDGKVLPMLHATHWCSAHSRALPTAPGQEVKV